MNGWIEHDGSGLPVDEATKAELRFRDLDTRVGLAGFWHGDGTAEMSGWVWDESDPLDIIAYRILPVATSEQDEQP